MERFANKKKTHETETDASKNEKSTLMWVKNYVINSGYK